MSKWPPRRVVVTGGAGFLGARIVQRLRQAGGADIMVPRRKEYDLRSLDAIKRMLRDANPDLVIHAAGNVGGIGANRAHPAEFFYDNLIMGVQLLHEAWQFGVDKFVAIGTVCAYPKFSSIPFREDNLWDGYPEETNAPYGLAKKMLLVQSQAYREQYGFNSIFLMPVNLYGPGDNFAPESAHVIPDLIRKCFQAKREGRNHVVLWGDGSPTREFLYVDDAAEGIVLASEHYDKSLPVNLGSTIEISIRELALRIAQLTEFDGELCWDTTNPNGQPRRKVDTTRAKREFGFTSKVSFEEGLRRTVEWYRDCGASVQQRTTRPREDHP